MAIGPGRPRLASREMLQEAAFELFQLHGYKATTVEQIARTAGFSRATFFNFFPSKADLFWVETDALIERLGKHLGAALAELSSDAGSAGTRRASKQAGIDQADDAQIPTLRDALLHFAATVRPADIPWALQHTDLLEASDDLIASGASRVQGLHHRFARYLMRRDELLCGESTPPLVLRAEAAATVGAMLVGLTHWIDLGSARGSLRETLAQTLN
ncbi:MAG: TetR family transcriptional regulator [Microbacteriaceae bacterium]|nr:TetR family transcriptional regulator [Microbacteriaceae bacterium]